MLLECLRGKEIIPVRSAVDVCVTKPLPLWAKQAKNHFRRGGDTNQFVPIWNSKEMTCLSNLLWSATALLHKGPPTPSPL